jgi:hypothetical protein
LLLHSNITLFLYSVQSPTFKNYTQRISPHTRRYETNKNLASVFISPRGRAAQLHPQALGTHSSRLLQHALVIGDGRKRHIYSPGVQEGSSVC